MEALIWRPAVMTKCIATLYNMRLYKALNGARALILYFQTYRLISFHPILNQSRGEFLFSPHCSLCSCPRKVWGCSCLLQSCPPFVNRHSERSAVAREKPLYNCTPSYLTHPNPAMHCIWR